MLAKNVYVLAHTAAGARCTPTAPETRMGSQQATDVGRWRKIVELGSGRTGNVTLCIEPNSLPANSSAAENTCCESKHDVLHAVKRVHRQCMTNNSGAVRRILQEKKALEALKGQNGIVGLRCTSKDEENLYFVLEPLLGGPLHRHVKAGPGGHLEMPDAVFYASEIASAIAHMHAHEFVHRDVKASNIVLDAKGHAKLVDLGCSKQLQPRGGGGGGGGGISCSDSFDNTYTYCGTPHCMAPEMVSREGHGFAVDWWALGILIHEMCTGEPPFGYGGDELPHRITAGLPREASSKGVMTRAGTASDLDNPGANTFNEENTGKEGSDERRFLPIVRRLLDTDPRQRLGSARGPDEVMRHEWFEPVDWATTAKLETNPPSFRKDLGELEYLDGGGDRESRNGAEEVDPDGLFAGF